MMARFEDMVAGAAEAAGAGKAIVLEGTRIHLEPPFRRIGFMDSLREASGEDLFSWEPEDLKSLLEKIGVVSEAADRVTMLDKLFDHYVAHRIVQPTFVVDYPVELSPLAKRKLAGGGIDKWDPSPAKYFSIADLACNAEIGPAPFVHFIALVNHGNIRRPIIFEKRFIQCIVLVGGVKIFRVNKAVVNGAD